MGREVRKVTKDWQHPKDESGHFIPLHNDSFSKRHAEWVEGFAMWQKGLCKSQGEWIPIDESEKGITFSEWDGDEPKSCDYMPEWTEEQKTHLMMYETTSEGTPISPAFETPEELARWLTDNGASAFGRSTASYEAWLRVCKGGYACSAVYSANKGLVSGVEGLL